LDPLTGLLEFGQKVALILTLYVHKRIDKLLNLGEVIVLLKNDLNIVRVLQGVGELALIKVFDHLGTICGIAFIRLQLFFNDTLARILQCV
jgi:hypothetical protein